ncbi:outer membrane beta-barrel protein [Helicobacter sp.]|uniref:outer membrane beta-barrel protein n=1 Tax=Helicobacter sp. TaxID=218 RepID=UPI0038902E53
MKSRLFGLTAIICSLAFGILQAENAAKSNDSQGYGKFFIGAGATFFGWKAQVGAEALAGYQYYFPKEYYIVDKFRQGIRGYGVVAYGFYGDGGTDFDGNKYSQALHSFPILAFVDYTLDFTPKEKYVWGIFGGIGLGVVPIIHSYTSRSIYGLGSSGSATNFDVGWAVRTGGSLTIDNKHRFELSLGGGYQYVGLRYMLFL